MNVPRTAILKALDVYQIHVNQLGMSARAWKEHGMEAIANEKRVAHEEGERHVLEIRKFLDESSKCSCRNNRQETVEELRETGE